MDTDSLRALWRVVSSLSPDSVISMPYEELTKNLLSQLSQQRPLSTEDWANIQSYLMQKEQLIRELLTE